ncbi:MAG: fibronectin type III domain-containing protein [bacterium]
MAIFSLIVAAMAAMVVGSFNAVQQGGEQIQAAALAQEGIEAVRSIRDQEWSNLAYQQSGIMVSGGKWVFSGEGSQDQIGQFTRTVSFVDVYRDSADEIVPAAAPGAILDPNSKEVWVAVEWNPREGISNIARRNCILTNWEGLLFSDCDLANINQKGSYQYPGSQDATKIAFQGNYAYVIISNAGSPSYNFAVMDVNDSNNPTLTGSLSLSGPLTNIAIFGSYAYISSGSDTGELQIIDISVPSSPFLTGSFNASGNANANGVYVVGTIVYLARTGSNSQDEFFVIDVSDPNVPSFIGSTSIGNNNQGGNDLYVSGNYAFIASADQTRGLKVIDISIPSSPQYLLDSFFTIAGNYAGLSVTGFDNVVAIGASDGFIYFVNTADPNAINQDSLISFYDVGAAVYDIALSGTNQRLFSVSDININNEFQILNISDVYNPVTLSSLRFGLRLSGTVFNNEACVAYTVGYPAQEAEFYIIGSYQPDTISPAQITDLSLSNPLINSIDLSWTAPGDDGGSGTAFMYDVRYSIAPITDINWDIASQAIGEPLPSLAGSSETMTVSGLNPGTTYHFAIKAFDEENNESSFSSVPSLATLPSVPQTCLQYCQSLAYSNGTCRSNSSRCNQFSEIYESVGDQFCTGGPSADTCCCAP